MKKTSSIFLLILSIVILAGVYADGIDVPASVDNSNYTLAGCEAMNGSTRDFCFERLALQEKNPRLCERAEGRVDNCFYYYARQEDNPEFCELAESMRSGCYRDFANRRKNPGLCEMIPDFGEPNYRGLCYWDMAIKLGDASFCDKIKDSSIKTRCFSESGFSSSSSMGKDAIMRVIFAGVFFILTGIVIFAFRKKVFRFVLGAWIGGLTFYLLYSLGYLFWGTWYYFFSRWFLAGITVFTLGVYEASNSLGGFFYTLFSGVILGAIMGTRIKLVLRIIVLGLYILINSAIIGFIIALFSSFN